MTKGKISIAVINQRVLWIRQMMDSLNELPLQNKEEFFRDKRNIAAAESYLRRALEALFDIGRHILAKKFTLPASEYKEVAEKLHEKKVLSEKERALLRQMAGYRNRMVHFYHQVSRDELYEICTRHLDDISRLV
ncbi:MAG: DUF86 domain-containing protein, partial [Candidatus Aminicenantales bacterium]